MAEIRNPNLQSQGSGGGGGDLRSLFGIMLLTMVILFGYQYLFKPKQEPAPRQQQSQQQQQQSPQQQSPNPANTAQSGAAPSSKTAAAANTPVVQTPVIAAAAQCDTTIENDLYKITFSNRGAEAQHWILKRYTDSTGKPLDLVQQQAAEKFGYPLSLFTYEPALNDQLKQGLYQVNCGSYKAPQSITFHYAANGLDVLKTISFDSSYVVTIEAQVRRNGQLVRSLVEWPSGLGDQEELVPPSVRPMRKGQIFTASTFAWSIDGKQSYEAANKVSNNATLENDYEYAAVGDLFFTAAFMPAAPTRATILTLHHAIELPGNLEDPTSTKRPDDVLGLAAGDVSGFTRVRLYAGPKQMEVLSSIHANTADGSANGPDLKPLVQFGFFKWLAYPLYLALRYLYEHGVPNWGWAIIIITAVFNLLMLPTRLKMMHSSLKMARIQPKVNAIKARYAHMKVTDPRRSEMNTEMMALYKQENVNMYGGCLPMLLQTPLFFALYSMLRNVIELRQAHWLWISDLSVADPLWILPAVIIIGMFVTQWITPSPGMDPNQRRMMAFMMPVVMGFTLAHFAAGLSVYWATSNVMNLAIQVGINKSSLGREMHELAARRAAKKTGGAKIVQGRK